MIIYLKDGAGNNCNSMPIDSSETRFSSVSYSLYPDNINYASIIMNEITWKMMINLYFAILCQEKIIIVTNFYERTSLIIEAIFKLMHPLDTIMYTTIGFISEDMVDFIHAPLPYIVGWSTDVYKIVESSLQKEDDPEIVILNLDANKVLLWKTKVRFPNPQTEYLKLKYESLIKNAKKIKKLNNYDNNDYYLDLSNSSKSWIKHQIMINLQINMKIK